MYDHRYLFITKCSLTGPDVGEHSIAAMELFNLSICERQIDVGNYREQVVATREIAIEIAERFLERHIRLIHPEEPE